MGTYSAYVRFSLPGSCSRLLVYLVHEWSYLTVRELGRRVQRDSAMISRFALTCVGQRDTKPEARVRQALGVPHAQEVRSKELARITHEGSAASADTRL
jgi:hypothetical protein